MSTGAEAAPRNQLLGTWQMLSATIERDGQQRAAYGAHPNGMLTFAADIRYVEVLTDADIPRFASDERGQGSDAENRTVTATNIGFFGRYSVDADGAFTGDTVEGCTFPNWVGDLRTTQQLKITIDGDRMTEHFTRPGGTRIVIFWQRAH